MTDRTILRGDDYPGADETYVFAFSLVDRDLEAYPLASTTVRSTWRTGTIPPGADEGDTLAPIAASISFDGAGEVTASSKLMLPDGMTAADGELWLVLTREETAALAQPTTLRGDVQILTSDDKVHTVILVQTITTVDGYTSDTES